MALSLVLFLITYKHYGLIVSSFFSLHLKFLFTFSISVSFRWPPLLNHDFLTNCLHYIVPLPLPIHLKLFFDFSFNCKAHSSYLPTALRKRMMETDLDFISMTKTCPTQLQRETLHFSILWIQSVLPLVKRELLQVNISHVFIQNQYCLLQLLQLCLTVTYLAHNLPS